MVRTENYVVSGFIIIIVILFIVIKLIIFIILTINFTIPGKCGKTLLSSISPGSS